MKRLKITNFTKRVMEIHSDYFEVGYCSNGKDRYLIGLDTRDVVSFKPLEPKHYKMSIDRVTNEDGNYGIWLWDMGLKEKMVTYKKHPIVPSYVYLDASQVERF